MPTSQLPPVCPACRSGGLVIPPRGSPRWKGSFFSEAALTGMRSVELGTQHQQPGGLCSAGLFAREHHGDHPHWPLRGPTHPTGKRKLASSHSWGCGLGCSSLTDSVQVPILPAEGIRSEPLEGSLREGEIPGLIGKILFQGKVYGLWTGREKDVRVFQVSIQFPVQMVSFKQPRSEKLP